MPVNKKILCITDRVLPEPSASSLCMINLLEGCDVDYVVFGVDTKQIDKNIFQLRKKDRNISAKLLHYGMFGKVVLKIYNKLNSYKYTGITKQLDQNFIFDLLPFLKNKKYDYIMSVSSPFVCHYVASKLKKELNIPWYAYEVDPYVYNDTSSLCSKAVNKRKAFAAMVYQDVEKIFYMPGIKEINIKNGYIPKYVDKYVELELPKLDLKQETNDYVKKHESIKIVYGGIFYKKIRNPRIIFQTFKDLNIDYELHIYSKGCERQLKKYKRKLKSKILLHDVVPYEKFKQIMVDSDVLLNIGNTSVNQIPSKIFDYFEIGKPIINIMQNRDDTSMKYMNEYGNALNVDYKNVNVNELIKFITNRKVLTVTQIRKNMSKYLLENIKEKFWQNIK